MRTASIELAAELADFSSSAAAGMGSFASAQLEGAVMAYNQLARNRVAYLADEVGMGKTYVALGVMGLLRHVEPAARVVVIAPRENIQRKWIKELHNFVSLNWKLRDNRVKSIHGAPVREPVYCSNLRDFAREHARAGNFITNLLHGLKQRVPSCPCGEKSSHDFTVTRRGFLHVSPFTCSPVAPSSLF